MSDDLLARDVNIASTGFSLIGSLIMCCFCSRLPYKNISIKLVYTIALSDFFFSVANLMTIINFSGSDELCRWISGPARQFFVNFSLFLATAIPIYYCKVTSYNPIGDKSRFFSIAVWVSALLSSSNAIM